MADSSAPGDDVIDSALAAARPADAPGALLAQARIAGQLFGTAAPGLGRFRVLERLGSGGMGVVYAAYDPQLDRGVALKTVDVPSGSRELALREAKALAKLAHPNVVPVFDVGIEGDQLFIVMELVRGTTLRVWTEGRDALAVIGAYRQAAQGLAAAHDAKLVHRDFKPDNAIVGTDGRVRVVDFGLAVEAETPSRGAGTPVYMAPEQAAGAAASPAADQYSLCVALREALPEPRARWIADILERGTRAEPAARFASMHDLVRALGRDPARVRRLRAIAAAVMIGLVGVGVAAFAIGRSSSSSATVEVCSGGDHALARAWTEDDKRAALARIGGLSAYGRDLAALLERTLATHRDRWIANHRDACLAHHRGEQSDTLLDRRMACLDRSRAALGAVAELVRTARTDQLPDLALAASALPVPDACADVATLAGDREPPPPATRPAIDAVRRDLAQARVAIAAGRFTDARAVAEASTATARTLGYPPLVGEAALVAGHARMSLDDAAGAVARLREATTTALAAGDDTVAIEAWARRAWLEGTDEGAGDALAGTELVDALATRSRSPFARALLANNIGSVELARGHRPAARAAFERALVAARAVTGPGAVELVVIRTNMAIVTDDLAARDRLYVDARAELVHLLGADHPDTLRAEWDRAMTTTTNLAEANAQLARVCDRDELHPALADRTGACWSELAEVRAMLGDRAGARAALARAIARGAETLEDTPELAGYARLWNDDARGALATLDAALARLPSTADEPWFRTYARAKVSLARAETLAALHRDDARALLETTRATLATLQRAHPIAAIARRLAISR